MGTHDLRNRRIDYDATTLDDGRATDPFGLFEEWLGDATAAQDAGGLYEATAMTVTTASPAADGGWQPHARVVLLKSWDLSGFTFFTNHDSAKGHELAANPRAGLHFHWPELQRQVRIEGLAHPSPRQVSEDYFAMRPRGSQVSAWASRQSEPIASRDALEAAERGAAARFEGVEVPCPPNWGGYVVVPERFEFWQGRTSRLHDRIAFSAVDGGWEAVRLCP